MVTDGIRRQLIDNDRAGREPEGVLPAQGEPSNAAWWGLRALTEGEAVGKDRFLSPHAFGFR